ncbi:MAG TPA: hypothetical protein VIY49_36860 [Bryobacteraceae bacterium]
MAAGRISVGHQRAKRVRLKDFDFGEMEAEAEARDQPDLLLSGFIDHLGMIEEARDGRRFLFLGYKGSGKSGLAEHLALLADQESPNGKELFVRVLHIADLSFTNMAQMIEKGGENEARFPVAWSWLLLLQMFDSFGEDKGANVHEGDLWYVIDALKDAGFLPDAKLIKTVETTLKKGAGLKLWDVINVGTEKMEKSNADVPCFVEWLKRNARRVRSPNRHLLVVDGLDDLLRKGKQAYVALECLLFEAKRLNNELSRNGTPAKVIVLCRTDLFDLLPGGNNNRLHQVYAVELNWSDHPDHPKDSALVRIINRRANLGLKEEIDIFDTFLPPSLDPRDSRGDIQGHLLEHTRRIPRDMVMLFKCLQKHSGSGRMTPNQVFDGLAAYSNYLVGEMADELGHHVEREQINAAISLFKQVRKQAVSVGELEHHAKLLRYASDFEIRRILRVLFDCSLIGNGPNVKSNPRDAIFKFRDRYATFNPSQTVFFHRGLWKGLDLRAFG